MLFTHEIITFNGDKKKKSDPALKVSNSDYDEDDEDEEVASALQNAKRLLTRKKRRYFTNFWKQY